MKKLLFLSLFTSSIFSMQLVTIKERAKIVHEKLVRHNHLPKSNDTKEHYNKILEKKEIDCKKDLISEHSVFASEGLGEIKLFHNEQGFHVFHNNEMHYVQPVFTDSIVRKATPLQMEAFQKVDKGYLHITQMADGKFEIKVMDRLPGGGVIGAAIGAFLGKAVVYVAGHGAIQIVSIATGPAYWVTLTALEGCFAVPIEAASMQGAIAGGMLGAVFTGPV